MTESMTGSRVDPNLLIGGPKDGQEVTGNCTATQVYQWIDGEVRAGSYARIDGRMIWLGWIKPTRRALDEAIYRHGGPPVPPPPPPPKPEDSPALKHRSKHYPAHFAERVPRLVRMLCNVRSDLPAIAFINDDRGFPFAAAGRIYPCTVNSHGAVAAILPNGQELGVKPDEFEVMEWHAAATAQGGAQ